MHWMYCPPPLRQESLSKIKLFKDLAANFEQIQIWATEIETEFFEQINCHTLLQKIWKQVPKAIVLMAEVEGGGETHDLLGVKLNHFVVGVTIFSQPLTFFTE